MAVPFYLCSAQLNVCFSQINQMNNGALYVRTHIFTVCIYNILCGEKNSMTNGIDREKVNLFCGNFLLNFYIVLARTHTHTEFLVYYYSTKHILLSYLVYIFTVLRTR